MDKDIINKIIEFRDERNWKQFHTPENLVKSISIESAELLECFQWNNDFNEKKVTEELADILIYCIYLADVLDINIDDIINYKIDLNNEKYPLDNSKGNSKKYNKL
ncbi:nucleotide pyrophosphohydrolase [Methanobrevibacter arboriphilus]|jgi:NTP pyrophosphatase (non-canonical NTP hydrolase)|uniref:Nucleotide pyrophosphohydrolase n=1 Tax=Methanobrevibacter arboriphilus TaxID=39441 RepID=A0ACA8R257_METAZ|nr:nucleotide pyrophosphohydrolase [Methanobrevibacter arboriphilus]BBL61678.1 nucleotide pyrophosphohydrolase [Methanobrevibacter arboriphilus]GLI12450.1 nucleotide pyrophosphohydrolase [Methanobrevibacter arboriphilus]